MKKGKEEKKKVEKEIQDAFDEDVCPDCKKKAAKEETPKDEEAPKKEEKKDSEEPKIEEVKEPKIEEVKEEVPPPAPPALAQKDDDTNLPDPERVHILEPRVYQERANTNTPNTRTTFYAKKNPSKLVI